MYIKINNLRNAIQIFLECSLCIGAYLLWIESISFVTATFMALCCVISFAVNPKKIHISKYDPAIVWLLFFCSLIPNVLFSSDVAKSYGFAKVLAVMICTMLVFRQSSVDARHLCKSAIVMSMIFSISIIWEFLDFESFKTLVQTLFSTDLYIEISTMRGSFNRYVGFGVYSGPSACLIIYGICAELSLQKKNLLFYASVGVNIVAIILTGSRTLLIMFAVVWLIYLIYMKSNDEKAMTARTLIFNILIIIAAIIIACNIVFSNLSDLRLFDGSASMDSVKARFALYVFAINIFFSKPLVGTGINTYLNYSTLNSSVENTYTHNLILQSLAEQGIIGALLLIGAIIWSYIYCIRHWKTSRTSIGLKFSILIQTVFLIYSLVGNPFYDINLRLIYLLSISVGFRESMRIEKNNEG